MPEEKFTRCPSCRTVFRVTQPQLDMRSGQVRCGHCHTVFDGVAHLVSLAPPAPGADDADALDEAAAGPPTVTLRSAHALAPAPSESPAAAESTSPPAGEAAPTVDAPAAAVTAPVVEGATESPAPATEVQDTGAADARPPRRWAGLVYGAASVLLVLALAGQATFHFRDAIAARWPAAAPVLVKACAVARCTVGPPQDIADLSIEASDLQADPAHKGLLILTATVRNRSARTLAYPYVELALTDAQDQVVVRRAFAPGEYAGGTTDLAAGIPANAEVAIKLFIDASATTQAGYRLYLFYV